MRNLLLLLLSSVLFIGCQTNMREQFERVQVGMDKDQVLGLMDSPQRTQRWKGKDRWTYIFYDQNVRHEKEVHFDAGTAAYVGEVFKPEVSAEEQDAINEKSNMEVEALAQARREDTQKAFQNYESSVKTEDTIRYVPQFEPVR